MKAFGMNNRSRQAAALDQFIITCTRVFVRRRRRWPGASASAFSLLGATASDRDFIALQFVVKRAARNPEAARSAFDGAAFVLQHEIDVGVLHLLQGSSASNLGLRGQAGTLELQLVHSEVVTLRQQDCTLQDVAQLANVPGPGVLLEGTHRRFLDSHFASGGVLGQTIEKMLREHRDVFHALAQWRHSERNNVYPKIKIAAKFLLPDQVQEFAVGCGDQPDVDGSVTHVPQTAKHAVFKDLEQLGLDLEVDVPDFIQEYGATIGNLEQTLFRIQSAGECAFFMTEKF